jgi:curved DNA-binding protein CbpA
VQNFYQLLAVDSTATAEEIKRAFRLEIARYHPDKVQHLGKEFQEMAATRAARLTEAYRTLMNPELRAEYDQHHGGSTPAAAPPTATAPPASPQAPPRQAATDAPRPSQPGPGFTPPPRFAQERATRDEFVRKAMLTRLRQVLNAEYGTIDESETRGFHFDCSAKSKKLFGRGDAQRFAVRFVPHGDRAALQDVWAAAQKAGGPICVFLMGNSLASARELGDAIADMRKRSRGDANVCIIPVDVRDWTAHMPADAPSICKTVIQRLRESSA